MATEDEVRMLAQAFVEGLKKVTVAEKKAQPSLNYGQKFNEMLAMAKELRPTADTRYWPKPISFAMTVGLPYCNASYPELRTYAEMILAQFPETPPMGMMG